MAQPGDKVKIVTENQTVEGVLMPAPKDTFLIKLDSGYNVGVESKDVRKMILVEERKEKKIIAENKLAPNKKLPTIAILHTGGTIASKVDYRTGGVVSKFSPEELVSMFPELKEIANIESELVAQMWSDDIRFAHLSLIAEAIQKQVQKGVQGIIIGMGTDNLAVAAAGLSFIIEKTPIPVLLVGAQRSSDRGSSDAAMNLICAAQFITKTDFVGVAIC